MKMFYEFNGEKVPSTHLKHLKTRLHQIKFKKPTTA